VSKGIIGNKIDQIRETRANKTRVHDKELALDMAYAEKPYREKAAQQKKIGRTLVSLMWDKYPDVRGSKTIDIVDVVDALGDTYTRPSVERTVLNGALVVAEDLRKKQDTVQSERRFNALGDRIQNLHILDPNAIPHKEAQLIGYKLQDDIAHRTIEQGIIAGERIQASALVDNSANNS